MIATSAWRLTRFDALASTSDACIARAEAGEPSGLAIQARTQTGARGSRGRSWSDAGGALAVSVLLRPEQDHAWPLIAGVALHDACSLTPAHGRTLRLKWPNDLMLHGRKLGGILIEASRGADPRGWLVIGFGANLAEAPRLADREAACLAELGPAPCADAMADRLLASLTRRLEPAAAAMTLREDWLARAHAPGTPLAVRGRDGQITGTFSSIAEDGTLLLEVAGEIRRFNTGEVLIMQGA